MTNKILAVLLGCLAFGAGTAASAGTLSYSSPSYCGVGGTEQTQSCGGGSGASEILTASATATLDGYSFITIEPEWGGSVSPNGASGPASVPVSWNFSLNDTDGSASSGSYTLDITNGSGFSPNTLMESGSITFTNGSATVSGTDMAITSDISSYAYYAVTLDIQLVADTADLVTLNSTIGLNTDVTSGAPEPGSLALVGLGSLGLGIFRRLRSRAE